MGVEQTWQVRYVPRRNRSRARSTSFNVDSIADTLSFENSATMKIYSPKR